MHLVFDHQNFPDALEVTAMHLYSASVTSGGAGCAPAKRASAAPMTTSAKVPRSVDMLVPPFDGSVGTLRSRPATRQDRKGISPAGRRRASARGMRGRGCAAGPRR